MEANQLLNKLSTYLSGFITEQRLEKIDHHLGFRTRHVTLVLEDIYQTHNASAVVRSCDCFGVQDLHVIENKNRYTINPDVTLGSSKWVDIIRYGKLNIDNTRECLVGLKQRGYTLAATTPHKDDILLDELDLSEPVALLFGTELTGLTEDALDLADTFVRIPMVGFTESFNISVSAAITLYSVMTRLWKSDIDWRLSQEEQNKIKLRWLLKDLRKSNLLVKQFCEEHGIQENDVLKALGK